MKLIWTEAARRDARSIATFIARSNADAAINIRNRIEETAKRLTVRNIGRHSRMEGLYEKSVTGTQFILAYTVSNNFVTIIRVMHSAQNWTSDDWP